MFQNEMDTDAIYVLLLDLLYRVVQALKGKKVEDPRTTDSQGLVAKLFFHASTLYYLKQGTKLGISSLPHVDFVDFASTAVIARSIIETYTIMFYIFFDLVPADEFEFRHASWLLEGFIIREQIDASENVSEQKTTELKNEIDTMRKRMQNTLKFSNLTIKQQNAALNGFVSIDRKLILHKAGFSGEMINKIYRFYSGSIHSDGLCAKQIMQASSRQDQEGFVNLHMQTALPFMAKTIFNFAEKYPESMEACRQLPKAYYWAQVYSGVADSLP